MALTISVPDRIINEIPIAEMEWFTKQEVQFDHMPTMETTVTCQNYSNREVWVAERSGSVSSTAPKDNPGINCFCIKISRRRNASTQTEFDATEMVEEGLGATKVTSGIRAIEESYRRSNHRGHGMHACTEVVFTIPLTRIQSHGGSIYHPETDLVLSMDRARAVHPGSPQSRLRSIHTSRQEDFKTFPDDTAEVIKIKEELGRRRAGDMARVMICIVDNENRFGSKYVNLLGRAHYVKAKPSFNLSDGVYVVRDEKVNEAGRTSKPTVTHYSFEDVAESDIKLYDSSEAALKYGDPEKAAEMKAVELRAEVIKLKSELERSQAENKLVVTKAADQLEHKALQRKDYYEERSHSRKDNSEEYKYVFAAIAGVVGLLAIILK